MMGKNPPNKFKKDSTLLFWAKSPPNSATAVCSQKGLAPLCLFVLVVGHAAAALFDNGLR